MKLHILQLSAYLVIIGAGMKAAAPVINIVLLSVLIAMMLMPIIIWLMKKGAPKALSLLITIFILMIVITITASILSIAVIGIADKIPEYENQLSLMTLNTTEVLSKIGINIDNILQHEIYQSKNIMVIATKFLSGIVSTFSNFIFAFLIIVFLLIDATSLRYKIYKGNQKLIRWQKKLSELADEIRKYISISALTGLIAAICNLVLMLVLGVDFPFLWAFLSFLFSFIPSIGVVIYIIPPAFLALAESGFVEAFIIVIGFVIIHAVIENVIKPKFMGEELDLSLFVIFISIIFWTWILGAMGAILAIPLTISFIKSWKIIFNVNEELIE